MFARIGSRHFAHLYISGFSRLRLGLLRRLRDLAFEGYRHDRTVGAPREDVAAATAFPHAARAPEDRDRRATRARVPMLQAFLDLLNATADPHSIAGAEPADDACLSRATGHGRPQDDWSKGRICRPTRWAVSMIRFTSS